MTSAGDQPPRRRALRDWVRRHLDPLEIYRRYTTLRHSGNRWVGLCPLHPEKTPSFNYWESTRSFYCFGCHAAGDEITFLRRAENLDTPGVIHLLQERFGLPEIPWSPQTPEDETRVAVQELLEEAWRFYRDRLESREGEAARRYLQERGLQGPDLERYGLGFAPGSGQALWAALRRRRPPEWALRQVELFTEKEGSWYDFFRNRIIFPIHDAAGRLIALAGRALDPDATPKYLNQRETLLFKKSHAFFGLGWAHEAIRTRRRVILVEGFFDALLMHKHGFPATLAVLGSHLSTGNVRWLRRRRLQEIVLAFDGDPAGREAAWASLGLLVPEFEQVRVATFPAGADPADILTGPEGPARMRRHLDSAPAWTGFLVYALKEQYGEGYLTQKRALQQLFQVLLPLDRISRTRTMAYCAQLGRVMGLATPNQLYADFQRWRRRTERGAPRAEPGSSPAGLTDAPAVPVHERVLLKRLMEDPGRFEKLLGEYGEPLLDIAVLGPFYRYLLDAWYRDESPDWSDLWEHFAGTPLLPLLSEALGDMPQPEDEDQAEQLFEESVWLLQAAYLRRLCRKIEQQLAESRDSASDYAARLAEKYACLRKVTEIEQRLGRHRVSHHRFPE